MSDLYPTEYIIIVKKFIEKYRYFGVLLGSSELGLRTILYHISKSPRRSAS